MIKIINRLLAPFGLCVAMTFRHSERFENGWRYMDYESGPRFDVSKIDYAASFDKARAAHKRLTESAPMRGAQGGAYMARRDPPAR